MGKRGDARRGAYGDSRRAGGSYGGASHAKRTLHFPFCRSHPWSRAAQRRKRPSKGSELLAVPRGVAVRDVVGGEGWRRPTHCGGVFPLADGCRARMAHASRASGWRRGHWRRALCLRAACQNLPSRLLATARGRRCRGILSFRLRCVERVATRALRGGVCLLRAHHRVRVRGGGAPERGVARAARRHGRLRDAFHATLPRLQRAGPGRLLAATARWLFDGLRFERMAFGLWHRHLRHLGDSHRVRPRHAHLCHLYRGRTAHRRRVVGVRGGAHRLAHDTLPHQRTPLLASGRQGKDLFGDREKRRWSPDGGGRHQRRPIRRSVVRVERVAIR